MYHNRKLIVFDIDGVLADFEGQLVHALHLRFGDRAKCNRSFYSLRDRHCDDPEVLEEAMSLANNPNFYYGLDEIPEGVAFAENLMADGHRLVYLSSRPQITYSFTYRWLDARMFNKNISLFCGVDDKAEFLSDPRWQIDFVVEDSPEQIKKLQSKGFSTLCWEQPWNEGVFPRIYVRTDGEVMLWGSEDTEATPFFFESLEE